MPRRPSFRRDAELKEQVRRLNKLVQNKQSRLRKNKGLETVGVETNKYQEFNSRRQVESYLKKMENFLQKKADFKVQNEHGAKLQYSEIQEMEKVIRRVNKQKKEQWNKVKDLEYYHRGQPTGLTVDEVADPVIGYGHAKFADFKPVKFNPGRFRSEKEFKQWAKEKEQLYTKDYMNRKNELYRENYLKGLQNVFDSEAKDLYKHIKEIPIEDFIKMYYTENNAHIAFIYDKLARKTKLNELSNIWRKKAS